jgi:hypothetical protein
MTWDQLGQLTTADGGSLNRTIHRAYNVRNLWRKKDMGRHQTGFYATVNPHDVALVIVSPLASDSKLDKCEGSVSFRSVFVNVRVELDVTTWRGLGDLFVGILAKLLQVPKASISEQKLLKFGDISAAKYKIHVLAADEETTVDFLHSDWVRKKVVHDLFGMDSAPGFVISAMAAQRKPKFEASSTSSTWAKKHPGQEVARGLPVPTDAQLAAMNQGLSLLVDCGLDVYATPGDKNVSVSHFSPIVIPTDLWVRTAVSMGATEICLTVTHKGGFILYASKFTDFSVMYSPCKWHQLIQLPLTAYTQTARML